VGYIEPIAGKDAEIGSNGDWICIAESKWFDDIHRNSKYPEIYQLTFEELLGLSSLVEDRVPGKYRTTMETWEQVCKEIHREDLFVELSK
jgi:hypothetical protein